MFDSKFMADSIEINTQAVLTQITIYPIKSLDGKIVDRSKISLGGALEFDRRWAIVDDRGKVVNAKRTAKIHQIRSRFKFVELDRQLLVTVQAGDNHPQTFCLMTELAQLAKWLSEFFCFPVTIIENTVTGFPDDLSAYGPTIISTATLAAISDWFPSLDLAEVRRRFRTNLEISHVPAFWEDKLFSKPGEVVNFQVGNVRFYGINPCQRCIVPTRNSLTGDITSKFQQIFNHQRQQTLPPTVNIARFNHFYRLAINTQIPLFDAGKFLNTGDRFNVSSVQDD